MRNDKTAIVHNKRRKRVMRILKIPNALTKKTIEDAHKGIGLSDRIENIDEYFKSL
jgi:hypothetical protein